MKKLFLLSKRKFSSGLIVASLCLFICGSLLQSCGKEDAGGNWVYASIVSQWAYDNTQNETMEPNDSLRELRANACSGLTNQILQAQNNGSWNGNAMNWNLILLKDPNVAWAGNSVNQMNYFIVYSFIQSTDPKKLILQANIYTGMPYNKNKAPIASFSASASIGDADPNTGDIASSIFSAAVIAGKSLSKTILNSGVIANP